MAEIGDPPIEDPPVATDDDPIIEETHATADAE